MLPDWRTPLPEDKRRFAKFVIEQLIAADHARAVDALKKIAAVNPADMTTASRVAFIRAIVASGAPPAVLERIGQLFGIDIADVADQLERVRALGFEVKEAPTKRGVKSGQSDAFHNAADDVSRIRTLFSSLWGKRNRHERPLAEEIAAERWGLSPKETAALIDRFQRKA